MKIEKMKKTLFLSLLSFLFIFSSCKKDNSSPVPTQQSIVGVYRITALKGHVANGQVQDYTSQLDECDKTSTWGFQNNSEFFFGGAATQTCQDPDFTGTWTLSGKTITLNANSTTTQYEIVSFDGKNLVVDTNGTIGSSAATFTFTFTKFM